MKLRQLPPLVRHLGPGWAAYRLWHALETRGGLLRRRLPLQAWDDVPLRTLLSDPALADPDRYLAYRQGAQAPAFFFRPADRAAYAPLLRRYDPAGGPAPRAEALLGGTLVHFDRHALACGFPPDWHRDPFGGGRFPSDRHWSQIGDFDGADIKKVWEAGRFGFAYLLVRAYWRTGDERFAEAFWQAVESWCAASPPQAGVPWKCGQETTFRLMAWAFGLYGTLGAAAATAPRVARLAQAVAVQARRIEAHVAYALSQRNNHGVSEGVGLLTAGLLFPEMAGAARWRTRGREVVEATLRTLVYDDGSFAQHSVNYHRVLLHDATWAARLAALHGAPLAADVQARIAAAARWLHALQLGQHGEAPVYGPNDGANVLPLAEADYSDYRPAIQAALYPSTGTRAYPGTGADEALLWLYGPEALAAAPEPAPHGPWQAPQGGYAVLHDAASAVFARGVHRFRHRPAEADLLHVDLWWRGRNVACDAGTYSYNAPPPWNHALARTRYHNTVEVGGHDQMERAGPFLWLPWPKGERPRLGDVAGAVASWQASHDGYARTPGGGVHRRAVVGLGEDHWAIVDRIEAAQPAPARLHWLLADHPCRWDERARVLTLDVDGAPFYVAVAAADETGVASLVRADPETPRGWRARYYLVREPALSLALDARTRVFVTAFGPTPCTIRFEDPIVHFDGWGRRLVCSGGAGPLVQTLH